MRVNYKINKEWEAWLQIRNLNNQLHVESASSSYSGAETYDPLCAQYTVSAPQNAMV